jgi:cell wall-associated NlpC family hydrolase
MKGNSDTVTKIILCLALFLFLAIKPAMADELTAIQKKLMEAAAQLDGKDSPKIDGKNFAADCSGTVRAFYWHAGVDLAFEYAKYPGNGTGRIMKSLSARDLLIMTKEAQIGDLIFWSNTYDANGNQLRDDLYTHVGMVVQIDADGTVTYIHYDYRGYVIKGKMNLILPTVQYDKSGKEINSSMRLGTAAEIKDGTFLAGALWAGFGRAWLIKDAKAQL